MKIVVLDGYTEHPGDLSWDELGKLGDLTVYDRTSLTDEGEIISRIGDAEVVFTNKTPISKAVIDACPNMKFISLLATGYNVVDYVYAGEKGIPVTNVPTYGTASVSQFSIALLLEICHHIGHHAASVHAGNWEKSIDWCYWDYPLIELEGKTIGIIGFGRIGQRVGELARAFKMDVVAYDPYLPAHVFEEQHAKSLSIDEVLKVSDYVTIHMPLTDETRNLFNAKSIAEMKDGAVVLNMARGGIVNEKDMYEALKAGKLGGYGSDVMENELAAGGLTEGAGFDSPLIECDNFIVTPHLGAQTVDASRDIGAHIIAKVKEALDLK